MKTFYICIALAYLAVALLCLIKAINTKAKCKKARGWKIAYNYLCSVILTAGGTMLLLNI